MLIASVANQTRGIACKFSYTLALPMSSTWSHLVESMNPVDPGWRK
jgi:hypothetical protein